MPISACTSRSSRSRGSLTASSLQGASHCIRRFTRAGLFLLDVFSRWSGLVFNRLHCVLVWSSLFHSKSSISSASSSFSSRNSLFMFRMKSVLIGAKKMRFDQYAGHCIVSNFWLHRDSHSKIPIATETLSAPTLARSNLIHLSSLDWLSWLLLPAASALSCHLLAQHPVSLHIVDWHWWKLCHPVFYLWSWFSSHTYDTCYF